MSTTPVSAVSTLLTAIHGLTAPPIPYWIVIVGATLALRTLLLPLVIAQSERVKRMKMIKPVIEAWEKSMRNEAAMLGKRAFHQEVHFTRFPLQWRWNLTKE